MSTTPPEGPDAAQPKKDARGTKPGQGTIRPAHGGQIGNAPFIPTDEQRQQVRAMAKVTTVHGERFIAIKMGISLSTLRRHFADDIAIGRADVAIGVGSQMVSRALNGDTETTKGDQRAQEYVLARLCGWTTKVEVGDNAAKPFGGSVDLSRLSEADLETYGRLAAIAEGVDPDQVVGDATGS